MRTSLGERRRKKQGLSASLSVAQHISERRDREPLSPRQPKVHLLPEGFSWLKEREGDTAEAIDTSRPRHFFSKWIIVKDIYGWKIYHTEGGFPMRHVRNAMNLESVPKAIFDAIESRDGSKHG